MLQPGRKMPKLHAKHRRLDVVEQRGLAVIMVLAGFAVFAVVPHQGDLSGDLGVVRGHCAAVAKATQYLERIETEASRRAKRSRALALESGADRLGCVLNHREVSP